MMKKEHTLVPIAALLTFALFAIGILSVLLGGSQVYRRLTLRDQRSYDSRTCTQYIATKLRQAPAPDAVSVAPFGDGDALLIQQAIEKTQYLTRIYCHDGWLMELFTLAGSDFSPEDGEKILPLDTLSIAMEGSLLSFGLTDPDHATQHITLSLRGKAGTLP